MKNKKTEFEKINTKQSEGFNLRLVRNTLRFEKLKLLISFLKSIKIINNLSLENKMQIYE